MIKLKDTEVKEGIRFADGKLIFDWGNDLPTDLLNLNSVSTKISKRFKKFRTIIIYAAYQFVSAQKYAVTNNVDKNEIKTQIDLSRRILKNLDDENTVENVIKMINVSLDEFEKHHPISSFDVIVYPQSSGKMNDLILGEVKKRTEKPIVNFSFVKNVTSKLQMDQDLLNRSDSEKTKQLVPQIYKALLNKPDRIYAVKQVSASLRRYFNNFLRWADDTDKVKLGAAIKSGKILMVDDTIGEGATLKEMTRLIMSENSESTLVAYILLKDY